VIKQIKLDFDFDQFVLADYSVHQGSCIKHQVYELQDIHKEFGGFPPSYCLENTLIHQLWWTSDRIDYKDLGQKLNMEVVTVSSILQPPGCVVPYHKDTFYQISKQYPERKETKVRANIYLEDCQLGHMIQYTHNNKIHTSVEWKAGEGFLWDSDILHLSCNAGMKNKFTLQVSGFLID